MLFSHGPVAFILWPTVAAACRFYSFIVILYVCAPLCCAGSLNAFLKQKGQMTSDSPVWSLNGNQGDRWKQAKVSIHPTASFQVRPQKKSIWYKATSPCPLFSLTVLLWWSIIFSGIRGVYWCAAPQAVILSGIHRQALPLSDRSYSHFAIRNCNLCGKRRPAISSIIFTAALVGCNYSCSLLFLGFHSHF